MAYVEVDLDDFDDCDLIEELRYRGYRVYKNNKDPKEFSWLKESPEEEELANLLWALRQAYILEDGYHFHESFKKLLAEYGYHV